MWKILTAQIKEEIYNSFISVGTEMMPQVDQRQKWITVKWLTHPLGEQDETKNSSNGVDWQQKGICHGLAKLEKKLSQNVKDIRRSQKLYGEDHGSLVSGIDRWRKKLSWGKDPESYFTGKCTITIIICYSNDATQPHILEMYQRIQTW